MEFFLEILYLVGAAQRGSNVTPKCVVESTEVV